jgi:hypothetical protein
LTNVTNHIKAAGMSTADDLLDQIVSFCARTGMSETAFGQAVARDRHLVRRLRSHKSMTLRRMDQVKAFMVAHPLGLAPQVQGVGAGQKGAAT